MNKPQFIGLSHVCVFVDDVEEAFKYYERILGATPDQYIPHWKNKGFFPGGRLYRRGRGGGRLDRLYERSRNAFYYRAYVLSQSKGQTGADYIQGQRRQRRSPRGAQGDEYRGRFRVYQISARRDADQHDRGLQGLPDKQDRAERFPILRRG